jgi:HEAT repeat protein
VTDEVGRLIELYIKEARAASVSRRLSLLRALRRYHDPRAFAFLLQILADGRESSQVRTYVLKSIRNGELAPDYRERAAAAMVQVVADQRSLDVRIEAALALGWFTDIGGVIAVLSRTVADRSLPLDLRYAAFTSMERAGPTTECINVLRKLRTDDMFGATVQSTLDRWRAPAEPD